MNETHVPLARSFYIFFPVDGRYGRRGWVDSAQDLKIPIDLNDIRCQPNMPHHLQPKSWADECELIAHERKARECGVKA